VDFRPNFQELMHRLDEQLHEFRCGYLMQDTGFNRHFRPPASHTKEMGP
jgi:hypothetical protein